MFRLARVYLSDDPLIDTDSGDTRLFLTAFDALDPFRLTSFQASDVSLPGDLTPGTCYLYAVAYHGGDDPDLTNNTSELIPIEIIPVEDPAEKNRSDFNGDGTTDILVHNTLNGVVRFGGINDGFGATGPNWDLA